MSIKKRIILISVLVVVIAALGVGAFFVWFRDSGKNSGKSSHKGLNDEDLQQIDDVNEKLKDLRTSDEYSFMDVDEQMEVTLDTINKLADKGLINADSIYSDEDEHYITFEYSCGVLGGANVGGFDDNSGSPGRTYIDYSLDDHKDEIFESRNDKRHADAIILDAMTDRQWQYDSHVYEAGVWSMEGFTTKIDVTVTLDDLTNLADYDFVFFQLHGTYLKFEPIIIPTIYAVPVLKLEQEATEDVNRRYADDLETGGVAIIDGAYYISPLFMTNHYDSDDLNGRIFFLGSCELMGVGNKDSEDWTKAFTDVGVSAFVGFHNSVATAYSIELCNSFMWELMSGHTAKESYDATIAQWGKSQKDWENYYNVDFKYERDPYPVFRGDENARLNWEILDNTPDPTPTPIEATAVAVEIGSEITMGSYGGEDIEWTVIDINSDGVLLLSKYVLDTKPYNDTETEVTWETCTLRKWLNEEFYSTAFTEQEKKSILLTNNVNPDNPYSGGKGGNNTDDHVFLLSVDEANKYFETDRDRWAQATEYARKNGISYIYNDKTHVFWWLRTPGLNNTGASDVEHNGVVNTNGFVVTGGDSLLGVRPAMWISYDGIKAPPEDMNISVPDEVKTAYLEVVNNISYADFESKSYGVPTSGKFTFDLIYVNDDDIPELLVCLTISNDFNGDEVFANLYTYKDGKAVKLFQRWAADRFDASSVYYPRENMVKEFVRMSSSEYLTSIANINENSEAVVFEYESIYETVNEKTTVKYYIYDSNTYKTTAELTELEFNALTTGPVDPLPLMATRTQNEITKVLS